MKTAVIVELGIGALFTKFALDHHRLAKAMTQGAESGDGKTPSLDLALTTAAAKQNNLAALFFLGAIGSFGAAAYTTWGPSAKGKKT